MLEGDDVLLARVRDDGDREAFAVLYQRHGPAARRFARSLCGNDADADDITAEVFTSLFATLGRGHGPSQLALPYLIASIRNRYWRTTAQQAREAELAPRASAASSSCQSTAVVEAAVLRTAMSTLPVDVRLLLWRTEVDDECVDDVRRQDGTSAHTLAVHRHRARRALGTAYLEQHAMPDGGLVELDPECRTMVPDLAALVRNKVGARRRRRLEEHLSDCEGCAQTRQRLELINTRLRALPKLPWTAGVASAVKTQVSGWLAASAVTVAGSTSLALAAVVPMPMLLDRMSGTEATATASEAQRPRDVSGSDAAALSDDPGASGAAAAAGDAASAAPWFHVPPTPAAGSTPTMSADSSEATAQGPASADAGPGGVGGDVVATPELRTPTGEAPGVAAPWVTDASAGVDRGGEVPTGSGQAGDLGGVPAAPGDPGPATDSSDGPVGRPAGNGHGNANGQTNGPAGGVTAGAGTSNGSGNSNSGNRNSNTNSQTNGSGNGNVQTNGIVQTNGNGQGNGNGRGNADGADTNAAANANGQANGAAYGAVMANGEANGNGQGNANGQIYGNGKADGPEGNAHGNGMANGHEPAADTPPGGSDPEVPPAAAIVPEPGSDATG